MTNIINVGDTLYDTFAGMIEAQRVTEVRDTAKGVKILTVGPMSENEFPESEIGKSIFRTRAEASDFVRKETGRVRMIVQEDDFI